jgi:transposase
MWTKEHREKYKDDGRRYPSDLTDVEWKAIEPLFPGYEPLAARLLSGSGVMKSPGHGSEPPARGPISGCSF